MKNRTQSSRWHRVFFYVVFILVGFFLITYSALELISGENELLPYIENDVIPDLEKLIFINGFNVLFAISALTCIRLVVIPSYDTTSRIVLINLIVFVSYGMILEVFRIYLFSRTIVIVEFSLTTLLLLLLFHLRGKYFPLTVGVSPEVPIGQFSGYKSVIWRELTQDIEIEREVRAVVADLRRKRKRSEGNNIGRLIREGKIIYDAKTVLEKLSGHVSLTDVSSVEFQEIKLSNQYLLVKQFLEVAFVIVTLPITLILFLAIAVFIKVDSPGPLLFKQIRVGYSGKIFELYKFRSMRITVDEPVVKFAEERDERVTNVGRFIRKTRIDEIPQLWNVLKGEMSIIGPRPEQKEFVERFQSTIPFYDFRHIVRPGITGWGQVMYGYAANDEQTREKLAYDFFYIKYMSWWLDLIILVKTIRTIVVGSGAR